MCPKPARLILRRKPVATAQKQQDVWRLRDELPSGLEDRRCEWRSLDAPRIQYCHDGGGSAALVLGHERHIAVCHPSLFECKTNKLAAALDTGPVIKLVLHDQELV